LSCPIAAAKRRLIVVTVKQTLARSARRGVKAARENLLPGLGLLSVMALIVLSYYFWAASAPVFQTISGWQKAGGILFSCIANGIAGGVISEIAKVSLLHHGRWTRKNREEMLFKFCLYVGNGAFTYTLYHVVAVVIGEGAAWNIVLPKVLIDQFLYVPFWSIPYSTTANLWRNEGYSFRRLWRRWDFWHFFDRYLSLLITCWCFWIPGTLLVYSLPILLQMPMAIFSNAFWSLIVLSIGRHEPVDPSQAH
jgi:hypothetical protein